MAPHLLRSLKNAGHGCYRQSEETARSQISYRKIIDCAMPIICFTVVVGPPSLRGREYQGWGSKADNKTLTPWIEAAILEKLQRQAPEIGRSASTLPTSAAARS